MSDYEYDSSIEIEEKPAAEDTKAKKAAAVKKTIKRKNKAEAGGSAKKPNIFSIINGETASAVGNKGPSTGAKPLLSSFITRVANGNVYRSVETTGDYYLEVKFYNKKDVLNEKPDVRYKKALTSIKLVLGEEDPTWDPLQNLLIKSFEVFKDSEFKFFKDNKKND